MREKFRQDDWDLSGSQFLSTLLGIAIAFILTFLMKLDVPHHLKWIGAFGLAPFGFQAILEIVETLTGKNKHVSGKVAVYGMIAGVCAFILPSLLIGYFVGESVAFAGAATDISLVGGFSTPLSLEARLFLITQAVADDLVGLIVIISSSGLHENFNAIFALIVFTLGIAVFMVSFRKRSLTWFVFSGVLTTTGMFGVGVEPLLGMSVQALVVGLLSNNKQWRSSVKNASAIAATGGLLLFITTHLSFGVLVLGGAQVAFNLAMTIGKFLPTFPLMVGAGTTKKDAVLGSLMSATSGTVGLLFLEISKTQGRLSPELEAVATTGIIISIVMGLVYCAIAYILRNR